MEDQIRPFLKWPGGKFRLVEKIAKRLPKTKQLVEPFVGSGSIFLNTDYKKYLLNDVNADLILLYQTLQNKGQGFIDYCKEFFIKRNNTEKRYYQFRKKFNATQDTDLKSALFLYLNRHGYNGLCRYNLSKGEFNVPFGRYLKPYFPECEMKFFFQKSKKAIFTCQDFTKTITQSKKGSVIYCDPPYVPITETADFTRYHRAGFSLKEQEVLAKLAKVQAKKGIPVLLSNHSNDYTRKLYHDASIIEFTVQRYISCKANNRKPVMELLALYLD